MAIVKFYLLRCLHIHGKEDVISARLSLAPAVVVVTVSYASSTGRQPYIVQKRASPMACVKVPREDSTVFILLIV